MLDNFLEVIHELRTQVVWEKAPIVVLVHILVHALK